MFHTSLAVPTMSTTQIPLNVGIISINLPPETVRLIFHAVDAVEALLILLSCPMVSTVFFVFYRSPLIHRNLIILMANLYVEYAILMLARLFCIAGSLIFGRDDVDSKLSASIVYFSGPFAAAEMIRLVACTAFLFACPCFIVERSFATLFLKSYETMRHNRIIGIVIALQWGLGALSVYCFCTGVLHTSILIGGYAAIMVATILVNHFHSEQI